VDDEQTIEVGGRADGLKRPDIGKWLKSKAGLYLYDRQKPTLATWQTYQLSILRHLFPEGDKPLPYSRILWSEPKKSGKTELAAAVHLFFGLFVDVPGEQMVIANDLMGAKSRTWQYVLGSLQKAAQIEGSGIGPRDFQEVGTAIKLKNGTIIKAIPSDFRGEAGSNHSLATIDEPWGIVHDYQEKLMTEFGPVPTRVNSTIFFTGYQGFIGQSNFWHALIDGVMEEGAPVPELKHIDGGDGVPACWAAGRTFLFWSHRARQPWHTPEYLESERRSYRGRESEYLRVWENRRVKNADAFITDEQWQKLYDPQLRALGPGDKRVMVLGADAATKSDCMALVGVVWNAEDRRMENIYCKVWTPSERKPLDLTDTIGPEIVRLHQMGVVEAVYYDPFQMAAIAEMCRKAGVRMFEFPQTARRLQSDKLLHDLAWGGNLAHYGDETLGQHITNAMVKESERGLRIVKEMSRMKVDAAVALAMACLGASEQLVERSSVIDFVGNPFYPAGDVE
jgi:phage terminase large subunit-like protein